MARKTKTTATRDPAKSRSITEIRPKTDNQALAMDYLKTKQVVLLEGLAGTGKTFLAVHHALTQLFTRKVTKIIFTRPLTTVGNEKLGFLPGEINDKVAPYSAQFQEYIEEFSPMMTLEDAKVLERSIEFIPLAYLRGRNFHNTVIIADEMQNSSQIQMKTLLTRISGDTQLIILGDTRQEDIKQRDGHNGLTDLLYKLKTSDNKFLGHVRFVYEDIQRSEFVKFVMKLYGDV